MDHTYQDGLLVCVCQLGEQHLSLDRAIESCGGPDCLISTKACDLLHRDLKCCNCPTCAVNKTATAGHPTANTQIPASHENVFFNLPIKAMWPFNNAACLDNTIFILGDPQVNYPTFQQGQLEPQDDRVRQTVTQFLVQTAEECGYVSNSGF